MEEKELFKNLKKESDEFPTFTEKSFSKPKPKGF